ncbi:MAG: benzoate transporter [Rhodocyclales bacterium RIFCSPLOWO2_02_FULL_63_24]|nr:MAG: benzoate transporter [Rhodocyclales bacterium GWA2_65_19]OHC69133.1 MAG: benzoate transporter [Rhodocyclales bacterium RIFCSPLOWO2_02_FULL_63_24]
MTSDARQPVSAVLITKNAAAQLDACLASLAFCDEILVVDSGSEDATLEIAGRHGARVVQSHWRGFGAQKQFAVERARHDWVLCIDADERVSERLQESIRAVTCPGSACREFRFTGRQGGIPGTHSASAPIVVAYRFARRNRFMGRYLRHGEGYPDWSLRFFDRRGARWSDDAVHEKVLATGAVGSLQGDLLHESAESLETYLAKQNRYSTLAAEEALAHGRQATVLHLLLSPALRFIKFYFLRLGLLDGLPGLVHILVGCGASFAKYAKMLAFQKSDP